MKPISCHQEMTNPKGFWSSEPLRVLLSSLCPGPVQPTAWHSLHNPKKVLLLFVSLGMLSVLKVNQDSKLTLGLPYFKEAKANQRGSCIVRETLASL